MVTGGSRGIGAAISRRLAAEGHDVVITYLRDRDAADEVASAVRHAGQRALVLQTDTTEERSVVELFDRAQAFGTMAGLVNNAGSASAIGSLEGNSLKAISQNLDVNLLGVIACSKYAIGPLSQAGGGSIVNISSAAATLGGRRHLFHYAAAKAAVEALTVGLSKELAGKSKELAGKNIRVNAVAPGTVWTDFHQDRDRRAKVAAEIPMGRAGKPHEIAGAVAWLLSDDAGYATGTTIRVAGGL